MPAPDTNLHLHLDLSSVVKVLLHIANNSMWVQFEHYNTQDIKHPKINQVVTQLNIARELIFLPITVYP